MPRGNVPPAIDGKSAAANSGKPYVRKGFFGKLHD